MLVGDPLNLITREKAPICKRFCGYLFAFWKRSGQLNAIDVSRYITLWGGHRESSVRFLIDLLSVKRPDAWRGHARQVGNARCHAGSWYLVKRLLDGAARLGIAEQAYSDGDIQVASRLFTSGARSRAPTTASQMARQRLLELGVEAKSSRKSVDAQLSPLVANPQRMAAAEACRQLCRRLLTAIARRIGAAMFQACVFS